MTCEDWTVLISPVLLAATFGLLLVTAFAQGMLFFRIRRSQKQAKDIEREFVEVRKAQARNLQMAQLVGARPMTLDDMTPEQRAMVREGLMQALAELKKNDN